MLVLPFYKGHVSVQSVSGQKLMYTCQQSLTASDWPAETVGPPSLGGRSWADDNDEQDDHADDHDDHPNDHVLQLHRVRK